MSYRELDFDRDNVAILMSEVGDMFRMHFEHWCPSACGRSRFIQG